MNVSRERITRIEQRMEERWRKEWPYYRQDNWTRRLIVDSYMFKNNKRNIDHYIMQMLSGHGIFNEYRKTIRKETHARCWDCDVEGDDTEHALFNCPRWINERTLLENYVGEVLTTIL